MALEKEIKFKGAITTYHKVVNLNIDTLGSKTIGVVLHSYLSPEERQLEKSPAAEALNTGIHAVLNTEGWTLHDGLGNTFSYPNDKKLAELFSEFAQKVYDEMKLLPFFEEATDI